MSLILTIVLPFLIAVVLIGAIALAIKWQWMLLDAARELGLAEGYKLQSQEEFDAKFYEGGKPFRDAAEQAGCDMALFDMKVAIRKGVH